MEPIGNTRISWFWGIGGLYDYSRTLSIRAQYEDYGKVGNAAMGEFSVKTLTLGLVYKFH
jgi:opacity protein-like surface antigen